nr:MAG TPA: hypothetical protein [Caudoviricetes sp.]
MKLFLVHLKLQLLMVYPSQTFSPKHHYSHSQVQLDFY